MRRQAEHRCTRRQNKPTLASASGSARSSNIAGAMRTDGRPPRRPYNGNRPHQNHRPPPQRNQTFDSNGPGAKIRGNAHQVFERYVALAREAAIAGDPIAAENLYQHAEHYFRVANANREDDHRGIALRPTTPADTAMDSTDQGSNSDPDSSQSGWGDDQPSVN